MVDIQSKVKEIELKAIITRADGSVETIGTISYWNVNPLKTFLWRIKQWLH